MTNLAVPAAPRPSSVGSGDPRPGGVEDGFARMKRLSEIRAAFDAADSHQAKEQIRREPVLTELALEDRVDALHLPARHLAADGHEGVRFPQVAVVLRDLVFEHQMISER